MVETDNVEALTTWMMGWSGQATFPIITPVMDDTDGRKMMKAVIASQQS